MVTWGHRGYVVVRMKRYALYKILYLHRYVPSTWPTWITLIPGTDPLPNFFSSIHMRNFFICLHLPSVTRPCPFAVTMNGHGRVPSPRWYIVLDGPMTREMMLMTATFFLIIILFIASQFKTIVILPTTVVKDFHSASEYITSLKFIALSLQATRPNGRPPPPPTALPQMI